MKCEKCGHEIENFKIIEVGNRKIKVYPIEQKGVSWNDINYPYPSKKRIPTSEEAWAIYDNKCEDFDNSDNDFYVIHPSKRLKEEMGRVARLYAYSDWANLDCLRVPSYSNDGLGVIFVEDVE
jgi:hypothetical protein